MSEKKEGITVIQVVSAVTVALGLLGGFFTLESHYVNHSYHEQTDRAIRIEHDRDLAQLSKEIQQIQKNSAEKSELDAKNYELKRAYDTSYFYLKLETDMLGTKARLGKSPSPEFDEKLKETTEKRQAADEKIKKLQEKP